ncbi:hypothetical protein FALBO_16731 [Fusarium albosuccineum]|uniref:2EXR domain-containing protein n=1 Tax=Fusarium albosuccineum TaxID=1237068 RepID=A0A8H4KG01_9HYPO|nr:hypothetical protein FALBO_16731 [Fusarium albosuccineum]
MSAQHPKPSLASRALSEVDVRAGDGTQPILSCVLWHLLITSGSQLVHVRAEIGSQTTNETGKNIHMKEASTSPTFPQFKKFPPEVRAIIWEYSFGGPRIFRTKPFNSWDIQGCMSMVVNHKPPASSQTCREAREVSKKCGKFLFGQFGTPLKSLWFNPSKDILYWDMSCFPPFQKDEPIDTDIVRYLAIDWWRSDEHDWWEGDYEGWELFELVRCNFLNCQKIMIVMEHKTLPNGDVQFLPVRNHDEVVLNVSEHGTDFIDWGEFKRGLKKTCKVFTEDSYRLPPLEPVEVVPIRSR